MELAGAPNPDDFLQRSQSDQDKTLLVKFYVKARESKDETLRQGRPVFKDVEYVSITVPGSRDGIARVATARDQARFPEHYAAFKQRQEAPNEGTPLAEWPAVARSMVEQLAFFNVKTVEQLAAVPDSASPTIMGFVRLRELAKKYIEASKIDAPIAQMQAELMERDHRLAAQAQTIESLSARLEVLEASQRPTDPPAHPEVTRAPVVAPPPAEPVEEVPTVVAEAPVAEYKTVLDTKPEPEPEPEPAAEPLAVLVAPATSRRRRRKVE